MKRNRNLLIASLIMIVVGLIARIYANSASYVDASGMLHDSAWLPLGTLLMVVGALLLIITAILYAVNYFKNRKKQT